MNLKEIEQQVAEIITPVLEHEAFELVDVEYRSEAGRWVLRVYVDKPGGVGLNDCAAVSHRIEDLLEVEEVIAYRYSLEVSSPGLDRRLKRESDFERFRGRMVKVVLMEPIAGRRNFKGVIVQCEGGCVELQDAEQNHHQLPLGNIKKAKLEIEL